MTINISPRDLESLSAYLDGQLSHKERIRLEKSLQESADLRATLEGLRQTRALLRSQPRPRAPRNFTLTAAMVGEKPHKAATMSLFPALRLASVLASFAFVLAVVGELAFGGRPGAAPMIAAQAPAPADVQEQALLEPTSEAAAAEPAAKMAAGETVVEEEISTETVMVMEATQEGPPEFPIEVPPETFTEDMTVRPRMEGGGGNGLGGGDGTSEEIPDSEIAEGTSLAEEALALSIPVTPTEMIETPGAQPQALSQAPIEASPAEVVGDANLTPTRGWSLWRWLQVTVAFIALAAGTLAFYLRRTGRA